MKIEDIIIELAKRKFIVDRGSSETWEGTYKSTRELYTRAAEREIEFLKTLGFKNVGIGG